MNSWSCQNIINNSDKSVSIVENESESNAQIPESGHQSIVLGEQILWAERRASRRQRSKTRGRNKSAVQSPVAASTGLYLFKVTAQVLTGGEDSRQPFPRPWLNESYSQCTTSIIVPQDQGISVESPQHLTDSANSELAAKNFGGITPLFRLRKDRGDFVLWK